MERLGDLVESISKRLVDNPDEVKVKIVASTTTIVIELHVAKEDLGKVIGKEGKTAKAIRTLLNAASAKDNKRVILEIVE